MHVFNLNRGTVKLVQQYAQQTGCVGGATSKNNCICVYTTTTSDMYTFLHQTLREIPASGKSASVCFNSHTWCFGKCLQNMVGDLVQREAYTLILVSINCSYMETPELNWGKGKPGRVQEKSNKCVLMISFLSFFFDVR